MAPTVPGRSADPATRSIEEILRGRQQRVHILTGAVCNNNCIFCMEEDREARFVTNSATTDETVRWILDRQQHYEEVCFTSGEPTTNPRLHHWVKMAKEAGAKEISMMTNGRALSHRKFAQRLVALGMNKFYISIHGHTEKLHRALTRTPGCFAQTVAGLEMITSFKRYGIALHTSTVVTKQNLPFLAEIYDFLRSKGVDQVVFNIMQANGRADTYFDFLFPRYTEIAAAAASFLAEAAKREDEVMAFFVDIPLCTTTSLPDFNRGYVEAYTHFEPETSCGLSSRERTVQIGEGAGRLAELRRSDLDDAQRQKREECYACRYESVCEGVWSNYLQRYGWSEFVPLER